MPLAPYFNNVYNITATYLRSIYFLDRFTQIQGDIDIINSLVHSSHGQAEARGQEPDLPGGQQRLKNLAQPLLPPQFVGRKLSSWHRTYAHMVCQCHGWRLYILYHNASPKNESLTQMTKYSLCDSFLYISVRYSGSPVS